MRVVILNNQARALVNFWSPLIRELHEAGHSVLCFVPQEPDSVPDSIPDSIPDTTSVHNPGSPSASNADEVLRAMGVRVCHYPLDRKGLNPLRDSRTALALYRLCKNERPDVVYASTIKPVIYGLPAAFVAGVRQRYAMITGLGYMFEADSVLKKGLTCVAALLYRMALACAKITFFQNADDIRTFQHWHCVSRNARVELTKGTGVDTAHFATAPLPEGPPIFLLVARLLEAKGLHEYAEAARLVKTHYPEARFQLLGPPEEHRGGVPLVLVRQWHQQGLVEYLGETHDTRPFVRQATVVVLPSWREGMPCSLMEAMSMGRPIIATDVPGCREVVQDGVNGLRVPVREPAALAQAMERLCADPSLAKSMGHAARRMAENELDAIKAAHHILGMMDLLPSKTCTPSTIGATCTSGAHSAQCVDNVIPKASPSKPTGGFHDHK